MAGHSKFKNIMHKKGRADAQRSKLFSKLSRDITVAAKLGMPDVNMNPRLRLAVNNAKAESLPRDVIQRAINKAAGGDVKKQDAMFKAMREAKFNSPRGPFRLSAAQNPIHNFYLRELKGGENKFLGIAAADVSDPTTGCSLA